MIAALVRRLVLAPALIALTAFLWVAAPFWLIATGIASAFVPGWLHLPLYEGSHLSRGIPLGAAIIIFCWLLTAWYVRHANTRFDALSAEILEENHA